MNVQKRILLIAYNFPPLISPQSLRWFYLSRELRGKGFAIDVLTIRMPETFQDMLHEIPDGIKTCRTFPGPFLGLTYAFSRESVRKGDGLPSPVQPGLWEMLTGIHLKTYRALNALLIPDIYVEWMPFALKEGGKLLETHTYHALISSSDPRICHLVGHFLKKKSGIPWIADFGDPWIYSIPTMKEPEWKKRIVQKIETTLVRNMNAITVAAEGMKRDFLERYHFLDGRDIEVVPQGFDLDMVPLLGGETPSKFRIVYCGSFYKKLRDPTPFFEAIREIGKEDIEMVIAGRINEFTDRVKQEDLSGRILYRGFLDHKDSLRLEKGATVLLHIGNAADIQIPGKIYEYIGAQRPILCIKGGDRDASVDLVTQYNKGIVVENRKDAIKQGILELYDLWQKGLLDRQFNLDIIKDFAWQRSVEGILSLLNKV